LFFRVKKVKDGKVTKSLEPPSKGSKVLHRVNSISSEASNESKGYIFTLIYYTLFFLSPLKWCNSRYRICKEVSW